MSDLRKLINIIEEIAADNSGDQIQTRTFSGRSAFMQIHAPRIFEKLGLEVVDSEYDEDEDIQEYQVRGSLDDIRDAQSYLENSRHFGGVF